MPAKPAAFLSYTHADDQSDGGWITAFRAKLNDEVEARSGVRFGIFQDKKDIFWGQDWKERIRESLSEVKFFIPILTPRFFASEYCREEVLIFMDRERDIGRSDLILSVLYIENPTQAASGERAKDELAELLSKRQHVDWTKFRHTNLSQPAMRRRISTLAKQIVAILQQPWPASGQTHAKAPAKQDAGSEQPQPVAAAPVLSLPEPDISRSPNKHFAPSSARWTTPVPDGIEGFASVTLYQPTPYNEEGTYKVEASAKVGLVPLPHNERRFAVGVDTVLLSLKSDAYLVSRASMLGARPSDLAVREHVDGVELFGPRDAATQCLNGELLGDEYLAVIQTRHNGEAPVTLSMRAEEGAFKVFAVDAAGKKTRVKVTTEQDKVVNALLGDGRERDALGRVLLARATMKRITE